LSVFSIVTLHRLLMYVRSGSSTTLPSVSTTRCRCYSPHLIIFFASFVVYFFRIQFGSSGDPDIAGPLACAYGYRMLTKWVISPSLLVLYRMFAEYVISSTCITCNLLLSDYPRIEMHVLIARLRLAPHSTQNTQNCEQTEQSITSNKWR